jgi:hypothetical protein
MGLPTKLCFNEMIFRVRRLSRNRLPISQQSTHGFWAEAFHLCEPAALLVESTFHAVILGYSQLPSSRRSIAGLFGFFVLSQLLEGPDR